MGSCCQTPIKYNIPPIGSDGSAGNDKYIYSFGGKYVDSKGYIIGERFLVRNEPIISFDYTWHDIHTIRRRFFCDGYNNNIVKDIDTKDADTIRKLKHLYDKRECEAYFAIIDNTTYRIPYMTIPFKLDDSKIKFEDIVQCKLPFISSGDIVKYESPIFIYSYIGKDPFK